ncbi:MAG: DUF3883 domain-containing protein [Betaproteobacteria bacterium]|nr:DUF3883 domain-containing protein [Betaproteobacteria bacterium]
MVGRSNCPLCCIEVKASPGDGSESFPMTANEWEKARECHQAQDSVYIIVRVANARDAPRIADVIVDPFGLYGAGQVAVVSRDIYGYTSACRNRKGTRRILNNKFRDGKKIGERILRDNKLSHLMPACF